MSTQLFPEHYRKALEIMNEPKFLTKKLYLHDYNESIYRDKKEYSINGLHWGYVDDLVARLVGVPTSGYYALIVDQVNDHNYIKCNSRYSIVEFFRIKDSILSSIKQKLQEAEKEEKEFLSLKKDQQKITIPLVFEGKQFILAKFTANYADEFDIDGFKIFTSEEWEKWITHIPQQDIKIYFGTNEFTYYKSQKEFLESIKLTYISTDQAKMMFDLFGKSTVEMYDWNGRYHNLIQHSTIVNYGMFPSSFEEEDYDDE